MLRSHTGFNRSMVELKASLPPALKLVRNWFQSVYGRIERLYIASDRTDPSSFNRSMVELKESLNVATFNFSSWFQSVYGRIER